jgi:hypothetical protein
LTAYFPGGSVGKRYSPEPSVTVVRTPWSAGLDTVTVTPGMAPPLESTILPAIRPVVCAHAAGVQATTDTSTSNASAEPLIHRIFHLHVIRR